jgi:hypothetical protein
VQGRPVPDPLGDARVHEGLEGRVTDGGEHLGGVGGAGADVPGGEATRGVQRRQ